MTDRVALLLTIAVAGCASTGRGPDADLERPPWPPAIEPAGDRTVFEIVPPAEGRQSTIAGGGRYDGLIEELGGRSTPGIGFGMGIERVLMDLRRRDEALARYDAGRPITQLYEDFLRNFREELVNPHPFRRTFAVETLDGDHIGNVMYYNIDLARHETEFGVTIGDPDYWGHGFGTEAVRLLVDYVFSTTSLTRIYLHTLDWNVRAQRAFHSAGFRDMGRSRRGSHRFHRMEIVRPAG